MKRIRRQKRVTLPMLMLKWLLIAVLVTAVYALEYRQFIFNRIYRQAQEEHTDHMRQLNDKLSAMNEEQGDFDRLKTAKSILGMYTNFDITLSDVLYEGDRSVHINPAMSVRSHAVSALIDEEGNIAVANDGVMWSVIALDKEGTDKGLYSCTDEEGQIPELDRLFADYYELYEKCGDTGYIEAEIDSIYYDKKERSFIPREGRLVLYRVKNRDDVLLAEPEDKTAEEIREIHITLNDSRYETMEKNSPSQYPHFYASIITGETHETIEKLSTGFFLPNAAKTITDSDYHRNDETNDVFGSSRVYIGGKMYRLNMRFVFDTNAPQVKDFYYRHVAIFAAAALFFAMLLCWRRYVLNKAQYAFEDYQRELTDHLAHDIKTPLMAIGGYTENILDGRLAKDEQQRYLNSILDNVRFTDSIVNRTLYLNRMDTAGKAANERFAAESVLEAVTRKYMPLLNEKNISYSSSGSTELNTDREKFETLIENLLSNAVKYTPANGSVKAVLDKKSIVITNTVENTIETKDLKNPFVRGDASRSNTEGCGLGLSIADSAAEACGARLDISCANREFRAEIKL